MSWRMTGELFDLPTQQGWLAWGDGALSGSVEALTFAKDFSGGSVGVTPTGPFIEADMRQSLPAFLIALHIIRNPAITGEPPTIDVPELPEGAVG